MNTDSEFRTILLSCSKWVALFAVANLVVMLVISWLIEYSPVIFGGLSDFAAFYKSLLKTYPVSMFWGWFAFSFSSILSMMLCACMLFKIDYQHNRALDFLFMGIIALVLVWAVSLIMISGTYDSFSQLTPYMMAAFVVLNFPFAVIVFAVFFALIHYGGGFDVETDRTVES